MSENECCGNVKCCSEAAVAATIGTPETLSPVLGSLIQALLTYVVSHADEIVGALMNLITKEPSTELQNAMYSFKSSPSVATLDRVSKEIVASGDATQEEVNVVVLDTVTNKAKIKLLTRK